MNASPPTAAAEEGPFLIVRAGSRICALRVADVCETLRPPPIEPVHGAPASVRGLAVIRGAPVPVVDLGVLLGDAEPGPHGRLVTLRIGARRVALGVDAVLGVRPLDIDLARSLPPLLRGARAELIQAVAARDAELVMVLDAARLLPDDACGGWAP